MANYTTTSLEATKYLCGLIRDLASVSEGIDDINLRSDGTFSSVMIDTLIKKCLEDSNEYTEKLVANLSRLELKLVTSESEIAESNILYLFKPDGATSYNQYVVIEGNKVLLGTCDINMADYIKAADVAKDYATKVELKAVTDKIGTTTLTTTDTTITGAIEEVKGIADGKADKSEIPTTVSELTDSADYAKTADIPTTLPANGGNADTVNNHTVESDVPTDAVFTDTVYDDTEVKESINEVNESLSVIGKCKNLLNPTLQTTTINGVTCTNNGDGTYTIDTGGSPATGNTIFTLSTFIFNANTKYKLIGCPSGGSNSTYRLDTAGINSDIGNGSDVQFTQDATYDIRIDIASGTVCDNLIFKPMLTTDLSATYDDFVPYTGEGETLTHDIAEIKNNLGGLTFSASGTTLSITDGTNTWTLKANS